MNLPLNLFFKNKLVGEILTFNYATPWASGEVKINDSDFFKKLVNATVMFDFDTELEGLELPEDEDELKWEEKFAELGLNYDDLSLIKDGWMIQESSNDKLKIYAVRFNEKGFIDWRF